MNDCAKGKILLAIIMGEILILTSCGLQERGDTHNSAEIGKNGRPIPTDMIEDTQSELAYIVPRQVFQWRAWDTK